MKENVKSKYKVNIKDVKPLTDKGGKVYILISPKTVGSKNGIMGKGITPVNGTVAEHVHNYSEENFFVIKGKGKVYFGTGEVIDFEAGSAVCVPQGARHRVENTGDEDLEVIFASGPLAPSPKLGHVNINDKAE